MRAEAQRLPELIDELLRRVVPSHQWHAILNTFTAPTPTTFRINTLKASGQAVREQLTEQGFRLERVSWYPEAFILRGGQLRELQGAEAYRQGLIYVQGLSSMLPPLVLDPQPGETVLDLTAAPGSKTTQIACLMQGQGRIVANDNNRVRFYRLQANLRQQGADVVELSLAYGEAFGKRHPDAFDRVLADVPCSAEGRFQTADPASYRYWKPGKIHEMAHKQRRLLLAALTAVRPGGIVVYSTCTFAPEENEAVVQWVLEQTGEAALIEPIVLGCSNQMAGLARWEDRAFHPSMRHARRILPTTEMEGFVLARLRKRARLVVQ